MADQTGDVEAARALVADDLRFRTFSEKPSISSGDAYAAMVANRNQRAKSTHTIDSVWGAGDWVVAELTSTIEIIGQDPAKPITHHLISFGRVKDGKFTELYVHFNAAFTAVAMGQLKKDDIAAARKKLREKFMKKSKDSKGGK